MSKTPDRFPGPLYEEDIYLEDKVTDPTTVGQIRRAGNDVKVRDSDGVFNLHTAHSHLSDTANPHSTTATQVGLGSVTNDSQLKRSAGDFGTFTEKSLPATTDVMLLEDGAASNVKKKVQVGNLSGLLGSRVLTGVTLSPWVDNTVPHGLGRNYSGFIPIRPRKTLCGVWVGLSGNQTIPRYWSTVALNTTSYDWGGNWVPASYWMVAPVAGDYSVDASINYYNVSSTDWLRIGVNVNGARYEKMGGYVSTTVTWWPVTQTFPRVRVNAGEYIKLDAYRDIVGSSTIYASMTSSYMKIGLVDDGIGESSTTNPAPETNILLRVSYTQTVDLIVF